MLERVLQTASALTRVRSRAEAGSGPTRFVEVSRGPGFTLRHYPNPRESDVVGPAPVLLVPPLIARAVVFDLHEDRSVVRTLHEQGLDVYLVDWGAPGPDDADVSLEDYILDWLPAAIDEVCVHASAEEASLFGYCLGGLFCLWALGARDEALPVRNLVMVASPVDASRMGLLHWLSRPLAPPPRWARRFGNVPGWVSQVGFWAAAPVAQTRRWTDLVANADDNAFVERFAAMNAWLGDFTDFPSRAFWQLARHHVGRNRAARGRFRLDGRFVELMRVQVPVLAFAGASDTVVLPASVEAISDLIASKDVTVVLAPGGHAGVMGGSGAQEAVWRRAGRWLLDRSGVGATIAGVPDPDVRARVAS